MANIVRTNQSYLSEMDFDLVVGIPRSGMLPASMIALNLNLPLASLDDLLENKLVSHGITRKMKKNFRCFQDAKKILIVDDSIYSGESIIKIKGKLSEELINKSFFLAIYGDSNSNLKFVNLCLEFVSSPRVFEWNIFHHPCIKDSCFDIDGVLCEDPQKNQNDDGEKYRDFILNAKPRFIPTGKINTIVTNRLEKYRDLTELWLKKYNVQYEKLIMLNLESSVDRQSQFDYYEHKSQVYKESKTIMFYESDVGQAYEIAKRSGKYVFCVDTNEIIAPGKIRILTNKHNLKQMIKRVILSFPSGRYIISLIKKL